MCPIASANTGFTITSGVCCPLSWDADVLYLLTNDEPARLFQALPRGGAPILRSALQLFAQVASGPWRRMKNCILARVLPDLRNPIAPRQFIGALTEGRFKMKTLKWIAVVALPLPLAAPRGSILDRGASGSIRGSASRQNGPRDPLSSGRWRCGHPPRAELLNRAEIKSRPGRPPACFMEV